MDSAAVIGIVTAIWAFIGILLPLFVQFVMWKSPNKGYNKSVEPYLSSQANVAEAEEANGVFTNGRNHGIIQIMLIMTAVCCYVFWLTAYLCQMNPLFGPQLDSEIIRWMQIQWKQ